MIKTFSKFIAIMLTFVFLLSIVPVSVMAEDATEQESVIIGFSNPFWANSDYPTSTYDYSAGLRCGTVGNQYKGFVQLDFSGYEYLLRDESSKLSVTFAPNVKVSTKWCKLYDFGMYILDDASDEYSKIYSNDLTYGQVDVYVDALKSIENLTPFVSRTETTAATAAYTSDGNKQLVLDALDASTDDSVITLQHVLLSTAGASNNLGLSHAKDQSYLTISGASSDATPANYLSDIKKELIWELFSTDSAGDIKSDINLPTTYKGVTINWTSSNPDAISSSDGTVTVLKVEQPVTLTADLTYTAYDGKVAYATEEFNVTVAPESVVSVRIPWSDLAKIQATMSDGNATEKVSARSLHMHNKGMGDTSPSRGDEMIFVKWDLTDYEKILEVATGLRLELTNGNPKGENGVVTVLPDHLDSWSSGELTYNGAINRGMYTDPGLYVEYGVKFKENPTIVSSAEFLGGVRAAVTNGDDSIVSFRMSGGDSYQHAFKYSPTASQRVMVIEYYQSDLDALSDDEFIASKAGNMPWSAISSQDINNVVSDLELPSTYYGQAITWATSDDSVINTFGEVTIGSEPKEVTLTATIADKTNIYKVTVPANKIALKSGDMKAEKDKNRYNYSTAYVYANESVTDKEYDVIIATYKDGELIDIKVRENVVIEAGLNVFTSDCSEDRINFGDISTKAILVDDITTLVPIAVAR